MQQDARIASHKASAKVVKNALDGRNSVALSVHHAKPAGIALGFQWGGGVEGAGRVNAAGKLAPMLRRKQIIYRNVGKVRSVT